MDLIPHSSDEEDEGNTNAKHLRLDHFCNGFYCSFIDFDGKSLIPVSWTGIKPTKIKSSHHHKINGIVYRDVIYEL